jgi:hypothetical protein
MSYSTQRRDIRNPLPVAAVKDICRRESCSVGTRKRHDPLLLAALGLHQATFTLLTTSSLLQGAYAPVTRATIARAGPVVQRHCRSSSFPPSSELPMPQNLRSCSTTWASWHIVTPARDPSATPARPLYV